MRLTRDISMYCYGFLAALIGFEEVSAWWAFALVALLAAWWVADDKVTRADVRKGYGEGWDEGRDYGYTDGYFAGLTDGRYDRALQKRSES